MNSQATKPDPLCFFLTPYPPPLWRCQQCPCLLFRGWLSVQRLQWLWQQQQPERRRRPGDVPAGRAAGKDDECFPRQQRSPGSSLHAVGSEKHPQPEGHWKCSLQLLNTSWSVELCLFGGFSCHNKSICYHLFFFFFFFLSQQVPQGWYILTQPTYVAPAPSAPVRQQRQPLWKPATPAAIWHLPAVWLGPTVLSSGRSRTSWVWFPSTTIWCTRSTLLLSSSLIMTLSICRWACGHVMVKVVGFWMRKMSFDCLITKGKHDVVINDWMSCIRPMWKKSWSPPGIGWCPLWIPLRLSCDMAPPCLLLETQVTPVTPSTPPSTLPVGSVWTLGRRPASAPWKEEGWGKTKDFLCVLNFFFFYVY